MAEIQQALQALITTVGVAVLSALAVILVQGVNLAKEWACEKIAGIADDNARKVVNDAIFRVS